MDATTMNNGYYGQPMYGMGYDYSNPYYAYQPGYQPVMQQPIQVPQNQNALTPEEIQKLKSQKPTGSLNLSINPDDVLKAICTHKENGRDMVQMVNDGSGDVYCPICQTRWNPDSATKEEAQDVVNRFNALMQNMKWTGELPINIVREYCAMLPLIMKFPELYEYGNKNFERFLNQRGYYGASDANPYAQYNSLFGPGMYYGQQMMGYQQPAYGQPMGYYQQPMTGAAQPAQPANPAVNPMQQPVYGQPGFNPQFADQANMMMQGTYYAQPTAMPPQQAQMGQFQQPVMNPYAPTFGAAQPQQQVQTPQQGAQPSNPAPQQTVTTDTKVDL